MNSIFNGALPVLHPSGENLFEIHPDLFVENERFRSIVRKTSVLAGGDISNVVSTRVDTSPTFHNFPRLPGELRAKIWRMGDPRIVEIIQDQRGVFISRTLVPSILHATHESREEGRRRYIALNLSGGSQSNRTFIDWNADTLMMGDEQTLQAMFSPGNIHMLDPYPASRIAIHYNSVAPFLHNLRSSDPFSGMEELYVVRPTLSVKMGIGNLEFAGNMEQDHHFRELLRARDSFRVAVTVNAVRDVNRLLEGGERDRRDRRRRLQRSNVDMLEASRLQADLHRRRAA